MNDKHLPLHERIAAFRARHKYLGLLLAVFGLLLVLVGMVGWFLPILPGWALVGLGLLLVAPRLAGRLVEKVRGFARKKS